MRKQIILIFLFLSLYSYGQRNPKLEYDTKEIAGKWYATYANKSFEIIFSKSIVYIDILNESYEVILGSIKYFENDKLIREAILDGIKSPLSANSISNSPKNFSILYFENHKKLTGHAKFDIELDGKSAKWHSLKKAESWGLQEGAFDIPKELIFTKVE